MLTLDELKARLGAAYIDGFDATLAQGALTDAIGVAEGYLRTRYELPLPVVPGLVKAAIANLANANLYVTSTPEDVLKKAKQAEALLEQVAAGKVSLPLPAPAPEEIDDEAGILFESAPIRLSTAQTRLVF